jgi:hypothetical protein
MAQFNALTGPELKKFLLVKIEEELDKSDKFGMHLAYPWIKYNFVVGLTVYPTQSMDAPPTPVASGQGNDGDPGLKQADGTLEDMEIKGEAVVDTPDKARIETNQPIPTTVKGAGDVLVDKPVMPKFPAKGGK